MSTESYNSGSNCACNFKTASRDFEFTHAITHEVQYSFQFIKNVSAETSVIFIYTIIYKVMEVEFIISRKSDEAKREIERI